MEFLAFFDLDVKNYTNLLGFLPLPLISKLNSSQLKLFLFVLRVLSQRRQSLLLKHPGLSFLLPASPLFIPAIPFTIPAMSLTIPTISFLLPSASFYFDSVFYFSCSFLLFEELLLPFDDLGLIVDLNLF